MLNKIYFALLAIAVLVMGFFTFYSYSWLQSIGSPIVAADNFSYYYSISWSFLWLSFVGLVVFASILLWKKEKSWSIWSTFVYFAIFMTLQTFWLAPTFLSFKQNNSLAETSYSITPLLGALTIIVVAIAIFFNRFIILRLREKLVGNKPTKS